MQHPPLGVSYAPPRCVRWVCHGGGVNRSAPYLPTMRAVMAALPGDVTTAERLVYLLLMIHSSRDNEARVSRATLARLSGLHPTTVKRTMASLRERGLVGEALLRIDGEGYRSYRHPLVLPEPEPDSADCGEPDPPFVIDRLQQVIDQVPF